MDDLSRFDISFNGFIRVRFQVRKPKLLSRMRKPKLPLKILLSAVKRKRMKNNFDK